MKKLLSIFLILAISVSVFAQESTLLRLNYNKGDKYLMKMNMSQNMGGGAMSMDMNMHMLMEVVSSEDAVFGTNVSFSKVAMHMEQGGMKMAYDSDVEEESLDENAKQMGQQMKPLLETVLSVKTNNLGKVLKVEVVSGAAANIDQFTSQVESVVYPEEKVSVGYAWTAEKDNNGLNIKSTYTVKSIEVDKVVLDVNGVISGNATGSMLGTMDIDKQTGTVIESNLIMDMTVMGQEMKSVIKITMEKE
ncbi:DUF6263 family protein [Aestuariivivens insulae]|uniref:DUF6263 family protein n=1 Tax=Aestuariivivens insulae TaxID=1621988 RepID=UPI001F589F11|nr:DUF6263 family protein [Aestuariivivens insulae]